MCVCVHVLRVRVCGRDPRQISHYSLCLLADDGIAGSLGDVDVVYAAGYGLSLFRVAVRSNKMLVSKLCACGGVNGVPAPNTLDARHSLAGSRYRQPVLTPTRACVPWRAIKHASTCLSVCARVHVCMHACMHQVSMNV